MHSLQLQPPARCCRHREAGRRAPSSAAAAAGQPAAAAARQPLPPRAHAHQHQQPPGAIAAAPAAAAAAAASSAKPPVAALRGLLPPATADALLAAHPGLASAPLADWLAFWTAFGLSRQQTAKLLAACPSLFDGSGASPYSVGRVLLLFRQLGWRHQSLVERLVGRYPQLLAAREADLAPVLEYLASLGCSEDDVRLLVWENPRVFSRDYKRYVRQMASLGMYGLPPPKALGQQRHGSGDALRRLLAWLQ